MVAFRLNSDNEFIGPLLNGEGIFVCSYKGDMNNDIKIMGALHCSEEYWVDGVVQISATGRNGDYDSLEVFGTTIAGDKLIELCKDLKAISFEEKKDLKAIEEVGIVVYVNRLGLCIFITMFRRSSIKAMPINDYFGWSKYAVKVPFQNLVNSSVMWNKFDMSNGETMVDVEGLARAAGEAEELRRSLEEKNVELIACKKELEEKSMEMTALKKELELIACKKELEWSKKMESLLSKLVKEKDKVINELMTKNQLLASKADD